MEDLDLGTTIRGFSPGQKVFNRFTLQRILGRGGMGIVWLARDEELEREVALKFLPDIVALDRESVTELKRETRRNLELTHPHIVRIYDFVQDTKAAAISMEYISGSSISAAKVDQPHGCFRLEQVTSWASELSEALSYAHEQAQVVHRDLKPANLMVDGRGQLKVTDFGIACSITDSVSRVSKNLGSSGTPLYMSPQQMMGDKPSASDDIYSFGATLYELLTGKPPFHTGNVILQVQNKLPPSIAERRRELGVENGDVIPGEWEQIIAACLAKEPAQRPASIAAIAEKLQLKGTFAKPGSRPVAPKVAPRAAEDTSKPIEPAPRVVVVPPPKPAGPAPRRTGLWIGLAVGTLALAGVGVWLGDVPNRVKASQQMSAAQTALFSSDWQAALAALRQAVTLRPTDAEYRREFDEAQKRWIDMVQKEVADVSPREAYDRLMARAPAAVSLVEPYSETYRRLSENATAEVVAIVEGAMADAVRLRDEKEFDRAFAALEDVRGHSSLAPEFTPTENSVKLARVVDGMERAAAAMHESDFAASYAILESVKDHSSYAAVQFATVFQDVQQAEVRYELAHLLDEEHNYDGARAVLADLRTRGILLEEVEARAAEIRSLAETYSLDRLAAALVAGNAAEADTAVADYARYTDSTFAVTGAELAAQRELPAFLAALEDLRMRPVAGQPRANGRDIALIAATRSRFADQGAVKAFLRDGFLEWSAQAETAGHPGLALYLQAQAMREGASADQAREAKLKSLLAANVGLGISWATPRLDGSPDAKLRSAPFEALRAATERKLSPFLKIAQGTGADIIQIGTVVRGPLSSDKPTRESKSVTYQSGTRQVQNYRYQDLQNQLRDAQDEMRQAMYNKQQAEAQAKQMAQSGDQASVLAAALSGGIAVGIHQNSYNKAANRAESIRYDLGNTPRTVTEPVYANEPYDVITHNVDYTAEITATPQRGDSTGRWRANLSHRTIEINGNKDRGVPVRTPSYPTTTDLNAKLSAQLVDRVRDPAPLVQSIADASFRALASRERREPLKLADELWSMMVLWRSIAVEPKAAAQIENGVRATLGLPKL